MRKEKKIINIFFTAFYIRFIKLTFSFYIFHEINFKTFLKAPVTCRYGNIGHELQTRHDIKLAGYGLRFNGFMSYSS